jgi:hypothetical protein
MLSICCIPYRRQAIRNIYEKPTCMRVCCCCCCAGGLSDAVAALHEALVMPAKYGQLLAAAPLRLRTGEARQPATAASLHHCVAS